MPSTSTSATSTRLGVGVGVGVGLGLGLGPGLGLWLGLGLGLYLYFGHSNQVLQKHSAEQRDASESGELLEQHSDHEGAAEPARAEAHKVELGAIGHAAGK